jgi:hypothetical protein
MKMGRARSHFSLVEVIQERCRNNFALVAIRRCSRSWDARAVIRMLPRMPANKKVRLSD